MKALKCVVGLEGFTFSKDYPICAIEQNMVVVVDDNHKMRVFDSVEGSRDFKNWFVGIV